MAEGNKTCNCMPIDLTGCEECKETPAGLRSTVYFALPDKTILKCSGSVTLDTDEDTKWKQLESYEITGNCLIEDGSDVLMRMLSQSMRFDRKTIRKLFYAVTHHKQVWFDVVVEFKNGAVDDGGLIVETPHQLRFLLNKIRHIRTPYKITDKED